MQHKIIIPTNFTDNAWNAVRYAVKLYAHEYCIFFYTSCYENEIANDL